MKEIKTILNGGIGEHELCHIPPHFLQNNWNLFLPKGSLSVLLSLVSLVMQGYEQEALVKQMKIEEQKLALTPFQFHSDEENLNDDPVWERERKVRGILERSGYTYPRSIEDFIYLFIQLGIMLETKKEGKSYFDIMIHPFPYPEDVLHLTDHEIKQLIEDRKMIQDEGGGK